MKSQTQHIDPLLDNWKTNWETSYLSATTDTPSKFRVAGETPQTNRLFNVTPGLEYELNYTQSENASVNLFIEESDNGTTWQNIVSSSSSNGLQTVSFIPSASFLKVSFEASAGFKLQDVSLNGELSDTLVVAKMLGGTGYRYGFNSMEKDDEVKGKGNSYDFGARMYDPRVGRWLSIDPLAGKYPYLSPYNFVANSPILFIDPNGKEIIINYKDENGEIQSYKYGSDIEVPNSTFVKETIRALNKIEQSQSSKDKFQFLKNTDKYTVSISAPQFKQETKALVRPSYDNLKAHKQQTIFFVYDRILFSNETGKVLQPFEALWHEFGHILNAIENFDEWRKRRENEYEEGSENEKWTNEEEKYTIEKYEQPLAKEHGDLIRTSHSSEGITITNNKVNKLEPKVPERKTNSQKNKPAPRF